ncbi:hypothetical protein OC861_006548 [Tilletia horrida]|nr:hypothetical protein OC861_006548 [Tilletia horrida]
MAGVLQVKDLVDVVLYPSLTMQRAVQRHEEGRSNYGMMPCNPSRISPTFTDAALHEVIEAVSKVSGRLLQTVNINVYNQQYIVAGELVTLLTTTNVLNFIKAKKIDLPALLKQMTPRSLQRGFATIPLAGIDVPFHIAYPTGGVTPFRAYLSKRIDVENLDPAKLRLRYIPNLVAAPFETSKAYAELTFAQTDSVRLGKALANWDRDGWATPDKEQQLTALLLIEFLVEFGLSPTLVGMAQRTHKLKYAKAHLARDKHRVILCHGKDQEAIYYAYADIEEDAPAESSGVPETTAPAPAAVVAAPAAAVPYAPQVAAASVADEPLKATDTIRAILAQKLKKPISEIPLSKAIKDMVGGKSTLQNELIGEFGSLPERGEEMPLEELGATMNSGYSGTLGKHTTGLVSTAQATGRRRRSESMARLRGGDIASLNGLNLKQCGAASGGAGGAVISSEELEKVRAHEKAHARRQIKILERYLNEDHRTSGRAADDLRLELKAAHDRLDSIASEHGEVYTKGILPLFEPLKARHFSSYWNWSRQDAM